MYDKNNYKLLVMSRTVLPSEVMTKKWGGKMEPKTLLHLDTLLIKYVCVCVCEYVCLCVCVSVEKDLPGCWRAAPRQDAV